MLSCNVELRPARHQELHRRRGCGDLGHERCRLEEVLEVVEHEQELPVAQVPAKILSELLAARPLNVKDPCDGRQDELGIRKRREPDEENAVGEVVQQVGRNLQGQPRLARSSGAGQGEHSDVGLLQHSGHLTHLALAADERRRL